jgi:hypothetical protein
LKGIIKDGLHPIFNIYHEICIKKLNPNENKDEENNVRNNINIVKANQGYNDGN